MIKELLLKIDNLHKEIVLLKKRIEILELGAKV